MEVIQETKITEVKIEYEYGRNGDDLELAYKYLNNTYGKTKYDVIRSGPKEDNFYRGLLVAMVDNN